MRKIKNCLILILSLFLISVPSSEQDTKTIPLENPVSVGKDDFTIVALPDTQHYSRKYPKIFDAQTKWIVDNKNRLNIVFVTHLGDIVDDGSDETQWKNALSSMSKLDGVVPYGVLPGNHDTNPKNDRNGTADIYNEYFPVSKYENEPWWGGNYPNDPEDKDKNKNNNSYQLFSVGSLNFIILHLEMRAPDDVLDWAGKVLDEYSDRRAIVSTHIYLARHGKRTRTNHTTFLKRRKGGNSGKNFWKKLIKTHSNVFMVLSGHCHKEIRQTSINDYEKPVFEIVQNYQRRKKGGTGWLRYYVFKPSENKIYAYTYSPHLNEFEHDDDSEFVLYYDFNKK